MKRAVAIVVVLIGLATGASAQNKGFGIGVIIGEPTGLSAKGWISTKSALDFGLAWSFRRNGFLHVHADYLWHFYDVLDNSSERFVPYLGLGGRVGARSGNAMVGVRLVGGLAWWPRNSPIDVFLEIAPIVDLAPATELSANGGIGIRFYFQ